MRLSFRTALYVWLLLAAHIAPAREYRLLQYTMADGLPGNTVYDIYCDRKGFLWLATDKGISCFDGTNFVNFTTGDGLPDNEVFLLEEDWYGRMWIGTYGGRLGYYFKGKCYTEKNNAILSFPFQASMINQIQQEPDSSITIFFRSRTHFVTISRDQSRWYPLGPINSRYPGEELQTIRKIGPGRFRAIYNFHTSIIDTAGHVLSDQLNKRELWYIRKNTEGFYLIGDTLYKEDFTPLGSAYKKLWAGYNLNAVYRDRENYFVATTRGVFINGCESLLTGVNISYVTKDREGNYWIGTLGNGVYVLDNRFHNTGYYTARYKGVVRYAHADPPWLFFCTQNKSLYRMNGERTECLFDAKKYVSRKSELFRNIYLIDSNNYYAVGNQENYKVSNIKGRKQFITPSPPEPSSFVNAIFATPGYHYIFNPEDVYRTPRSGPGKDKTYRLPRMLPPGDIIFSKAAAADGSIWFSSGNHIYRINDSDERPVLMRQFGDISFRSFGIYGNYLVGYTHNFTLVICNHFDRKIAIDSVKNTSCVWDKLYPLDDRHVLISTNNKYRILTLYPSAGKPLFSVHELNDPFVPLYAEYVCASGSNCYFFKAGDITCIPLAYLYGQKKPPPTVLTSVKTPAMQYEADHALCLPYAEAKYINITLAAPVLETKVSFEYSVTDKNDTDSWRPVNGTSISLYNLGYGYHIIKVRARTDAPLPGETAILELYISRPFWATWWFIAACAIPTALIAWGAVQFRIKRALRKKEKAHDMQIKFLRSEYRSLNALMNPHFIFNALNSVQWLINSGDKEVANEYLHIFSELVRQNMHNLTRERITVQQEITLVANYLKLEKLRFKNTLHYEIEIEEHIGTEEILIPPLLLQPLVENAIRHGFHNRQQHDNRVWIHITESSAGLLIQVADNGVGLHSGSNTAVHDSYGLKNIQKRLEQLAQIHNTSITLTIQDRLDVNGYVAGTEATVKISM
jgi:hypothetical protein